MHNYHPTLWTRSIEYSISRCIIIECMYYYIETVRYFEYIVCDQWTQKKNQFETFTSG